MEIEPDILLLNYEKAAQALCMSVGALRDLVYKGFGPVTVKIGRRTFFTPEDLRKFVNDRRVEFQ